VYVRKRVRECVCEKKRENERLEEIEYMKNMEV
jgi:hypothetical protein